MHVDGCFQGFFDVIAAGADFRMTQGITSVQSVTNWKHVVDEFRKSGVVIGVFHCVSMQFPVHQGSCGGSPLMFLTQECQQWRTSFGFYDFSFEFVGEGSFWQMQDASAVGKQSNFLMLVTVVDHAGFSKIVDIDVGLCRKRQLFIGRVVILVAFDPSQRKRVCKCTPAHHNFIDHIQSSFKVAFAKCSVKDEASLTLATMPCCHKSPGGQLLFLFDGVECTESGISKLTVLHSLLPGKSLV